ncbi:MAG: hypothetical protein WB680_09155 [Candidatus Acidiferrales bacterium]
MAPIGLGLTMSIQSGSSALDSADATGTAPSQVVYHVPPASQAPAAPSDAAQQDTVTLSGKSPATRNQTASQNFVSAAAFTLLAHEFTFPPDTSADANTPAAGNSNTAAATANQAVETPQSPPPTFTPGSVNATAVAVAIAAAQPAIGSNAANAAGSNANSTGAASASAMTPEETLQQLDQELQRLGINPQDISLMNRMSLLLWVNDPVALRQFVQGMQPSAIGSQANSATDPFNAQTSVAPSTGGATNSSQGPGVAAIQSGSASQSTSQNQSAVTTQNQLQVPLQQVLQNSSGLQSGGNNGSTAGLTNAPQQQITTAALQLQELHASLAVAGQAAQASSSGDPDPQAQGQYVNISA